MYELDLQKDEYIPQTQKKYFDYALDYALMNNEKSVKVNRIKFYFDFDNMRVMIGRTEKTAHIYNMKVGYLPF